LLAKRIQILHYKYYTFLLTCRSFEPLVVRRSQILSMKIWSISVEKSCCRSKSDEDPALWLISGPDSGWFSNTSSLTKFYVSSLNLIVKIWKNPHEKLKYEVT
jgi:hypothetical protein